MPKIIVIGHSHILALRRAHALASSIDSQDIDFLLLREPALRLPPEPGMTEQAHKARTQSVEGVDKVRVAARIEQSAADVAILSINGNEYSLPGLLTLEGIDHATKELRLRESIVGQLSTWLDFLMPLLPKRVLFYGAPPPVGAEQLDGNFPADRVAMFKGMTLESPAFRVRLWRLQCQSVREICERYGVEFIEPPASVFDASGLLARDCWGDEPTHGNTEYGRRILARLVEVIAGDHAGDSSRPAPTPEVAKLAPHPYVDLPDASFWKQAVSLVPAVQVDPLTAPPFIVTRTDRVATAGSCFAQHISKRLRDSGFQFFIAEPAPQDEASGEDRGFYDFSARYGNLYTARQLVQLFDRAFGYFRPIDRAWQRRGGGFCDPWRPRVEPEGFASEVALEQDRARHLAAVRRMFKRLDVFVFTLGLTECWMSRLDGAVYPIAPGVVGGEFDPSRHVFKNFSVAETVADLEAFIAKLKLVNARARLILTVSPVPLVATASDRHVLASTTYSKSVLRVAAEEICRAHEHVCYFPSYEIITGPHAVGGYFEADRRSVTAAGVDHVMRVFMARMTDASPADPRAAAEPSHGAASDAAMAELEALADAACDEEMLAR